MTNLPRRASIAAYFVLTSVLVGQDIQDMALEPLAFLSGRWVSQTGTELQEETWAPITGDSMTGSFRIVKRYYVR